MKYTFQAPKDDGETRKMDNHFFKKLTPMPKQKKQDPCICTRRVA